METELPNKNIKLEVEEVTENASILWDFTNNKIYI